MFFVGHMAGRINVDTVIELVAEDVRSAIQRLTTDTPQPAPPPAAFWQDATALVDSGAAICNNSTMTAWPNTGLPNTKPLFVFWFGPETKYSREWRSP